MTHIANRKQYLTSQYNHLQQPLTTTHQFRYYCPSGSSGISSCPSGQYSGSGASGCTSCPGGQYQGSSAQTGCNTCPGGSVNRKPNQLVRKEHCPNPVNDIRNEMYLDITAHQVPRAFIHVVRASTAVTAKHPAPTAPEDNTKGPLNRPAATDVVLDTSAQKGLQDRTVAPQGK